MIRRFSPPVCPPSVRSGVGPYKFPPFRPSRTAHWSTHDEDQPLRAHTGGPCAPRALVQSAEGRGMDFFISRSPGLTWPVSTISVRAGPCREGGLSSTDERVREGSCHRTNSHTGSSAVV